MKQEWQTKPLGEVCVFFNGLWKGKRSPFVSVDVIRNTNFTKEGVLDYSDIARLEVETRQFVNRRLQYGDVILEKSGGGPRQPVGRVALFDRSAGQFSFSNFTSAIRVRDSQVLDFRFLHKFLFWTYISGVTEQMQTHSTGIRNLDFGAYKEIPIPLPPLSEQRRIVGILDAAFAAIAAAQANTEKNLQNARALFESHLNTVFSQKGDGWVEKRLGECCVFENGDRGKNYPSRSAQTSSGIPFINAGHLFDSGLDFESMNYIPRERFDRLGAGKVKENDILFCLRGSLGKCASVGNLSEGAIASSLVIVRPMKEVSSDFLLSYFQTYQCAKMINKYKNGAAQPNLSANSLKSFLIHVPPLCDQRLIIDSLDALSAETRRLEGLYTRKQDRLSALKQSLLHAAFSGEL